MLSYEEIIKNCTNYSISDGVIRDKTNNIITDENLILKIKSSILLYREAKESYQSDIIQFGKVSKDQEHYIRKTMEKFGVNNEQNSFGINKLVNAILNSNGHYEENMSGNDLVNSKFSMLVGPKSDYGLSYLKMKFREKGLDIEDLKVSQDLTELQHNGVSKVIIDFKVKKYERTIQDSQTIDNANRQELNVQQSTIQHPRASELNELEKQKQLAKSNNDEVAYNYAQSAIEKIIRESRLEISPNKWTSMSAADKSTFFKIKMNESKILKDETEFNYWSTLLNNNNQKDVLDNNKVNGVQTTIQALNSNPIEEFAQPTYNSAPSNNIEFAQNAITQNEQQKDYNYYFEEMVKATKKYNPSKQLTEENKKQIIGEIFYNEGYLIESLTSDEDIRQIMTRTVNELSSNQMQIRLQNIIFSEMQEKLKQMHPERKQEVKKNIQEQEVEPTIQKKETRLDLSGFITQLKSKLNQVQNAYRSMMSDGYIDDEELPVLLGMVDKVIDDGYSVKSLADNQHDLEIISVIIDTLEAEKKKMTKLQNGIEEIGRSMR